MLVSKALPVLIINLKKETALSANSLVVILFALFYSSYDKNVR